MASIEKTIARIIKNNPGTAFIKALFLKWSLIVIIPAITGTYILFKTLSNAGFFTKVETILIDITTESQSIIQNCMPKLAYNQQPLKSFFNCASNPPALKSSDMLLDIEAATRAFEGAQQEEATDASSPQRQSKMQQYKEMINQIQDPYETDAN
jgi:hypothetical protein